MGGMCRSFTINAAGQVCKQIIECVYLGGAVDNSVSRLRGVFRDYGCVRWSPNKPDYDRLPQVHHLLHAPPMPRLVETEASAMTTPSRTPTRLPRKPPSESMEATAVRKWRIKNICGIRPVARMGEERLPRRVICLVGGKRVAQEGKRRIGWCA